MVDEIAPAIAVPLMLIFWAAALYQRRDAIAHWLGWRNREK